MTRVVLLYAALANLLAVIEGCSVEVEVKHPPVPVANDENCKDEYVKSIQDEEVRRELGSACFHRDDEPNYQPQPGKGWKP